MSKKSKNFLIGLIVVLIVFIGLDKITSTKENNYTPEGPPVPTIQRDKCEIAKELLFKYKIQNEDIEKFGVKKDYGEYIKIVNLEDYFFANGELNSPGGYKWETVELNEYVCQITILLYEKEDKERINPIWNIENSTIKWVNIGAFNITPELDYSND